jgi:hypothetical protein
MSQVSDVQNCLPSAPKDPSLVEMVPTSEHPDCPVSSRTFNG